MRRRHVALGLVLLLAACGFEPYDGPVTGSDMKPGPGLFTGPAGAFVLQRGTAPVPAKP